jgi:hypothetical protein
MLEEEVWWSMNGKDFPRLPFSSRQLPIWRTLVRLQFHEGWDEWGLWDKFIYIYILLASTAPFINNGLDERDSTYSVANTDLLTDLVNSAVDRLKSDFEASGGDMASLEPQEQVPTRKKAPVTQTNDSGSTNAQPFLRRSTRSYVAAVLLFVELMLLYFQASKEW